MTNELDRARNAVYVAFIANGFTWGSYVPRIPDIKAHFGLSNSALGLTLLSAAVGVLAALQLSGKWSARYGSATIVRIGQIEERVLNCRESNAETNSAEECSRHRTNTTNNRSHHEGKRQQDVKR